MDSTQPPNSTRWPGLKPSRPIDFDFDYETHTYTVNGIVWPSPSSLLKEFGYVDERWYKQWHKDRGHAVHAATHLYDVGDLDSSSLTPEVDSYLAGWKKFRETHNFWPIPELREKPMVCATYRFGCTPDAPGYIGDTPAIIEIKTGKPSIKAAKKQTAAQSVALDEAFGFLALIRMVVILSPNKFKPIELDDALGDRKIFLDMVGMHWDKRR